jgi:hypothetical protein
VAIIQHDSLATGAVVDKLQVAYHRNLEWCSSQAGDMASEVLPSSAQAADMARNVIESSTRPEPLCVHASLIQLIFKFNQIIPAKQVQPPLVCNISRRLRIEIYRFQMI